MEDQEILLKKCQELDLKVSSKTHKHGLKRKLVDLGVNVDELTRNGSNQLPPATVCVSGHGWSMSLTQPPPFLPDKFRDIFANFSNKHTYFIDIYISNLALVGNKYSGNPYCATAEYDDKDLFLHWSVLNAEALHTAITQRCTTNFCDNCESWYHPPSQCLFHLHMSGENMATGSTLLVDKDKASDKAICSKPDYPYFHTCRYSDQFNHNLCQCPITARK